MYPLETQIWAVSHEQTILREQIMFWNEVAAANWQQGAMSAAYCHVAQLWEERQRKLRFLQYLISWTFTE